MPTGDALIWHGDVALNVPLVRGAATEHASTILTSNKGFEDWGEIFGEDVMAAALVDRGGSPGEAPRSP